MKTYAALSSTSRTYHVPIMQQAAYPHVLVSFYYDKRRRFFDALGYPVGTPMLDSGAHTAYTKGIDLKLGDYIEWAKAYAEQQPRTRVTNLDIIPDSPHGGAPTKRAIAKAVKQSVENAGLIREAGLRVVEVYHLFEPLDAWEAILERRRDGEAVGVGGLAANRRRSGHLAEAFGDACFARVRDICGWDAVPPIHAFGISDAAMGWRYPLASIDASSWMGPARYGVRLNRAGTFTTTTIPSRLKQRELAVLHCVEVLEAWKKRESLIAAHWERRGVTILPEGDAIYGNEAEATAA